MAASSRKRTNKQLNANTEPGIVSMRSHVKLEHTGNDSGSLSNSTEPGVTSIERKQLFNWSLVEFKWEIVLNNVN